MLIFRFTFLLTSILLSTCQASTHVEELLVKDSTKSIKINGLSFVASSHPYAVGELEVLQQTHANHLAIMPYGFMPTLKSPDLRFDHPRQCWGERTEGCIETINHSRKEGFEIMLKPQIWIGGGDFTRFIEMNSEKEWLQFEENYANFILNFARVAEDQKVELFCIGTELGKVVAARPQFWTKLVNDVRKIYGGKLTYAENWDCFDKPVFLKDMDYISVDAYFPLNDGKNPTEQEIRDGWKSHVEKMKTCAEINQKQILITECGYRSMDYAGSKPWDCDKKEANVNQELQSRLLTVMFELWDNEWMAGGYIWKWFPFHSRAGGENDDQFTPQNKIVERTILDFYKLSKN